MVKFTYNQNEKKMTWTLNGRIDTFSCGNLDDMILGKIAAMKGTDDPKVLLEETIVLDLKDVDYISSAFFRICLTASKQVHEGNFSIINCNPFIKKIFTIAGLEEILNVT